jgi:hypothetical protein
VLRDKAAILDLRADTNDLLLKRLGEGLYADCFPEASGEAEDAGKWAERLADDEDAPELRIFVMVDDPEKHNPSILGFVCTERYPTSNCALISYLGVDSKQRQHHAGTELLKHALAALSQTAPQAIFTEVHDPDLVDGAHDVMEPSERFSFFAKNGGRRVPIVYVQPKVDPKRDYVRTLALVTLPVSGRDHKTIAPEIVGAFLREYYKTEGGANDPELNAMVEKLPSKPLPLGHLNEQREEPKFNFTRYGIALHYVCADEPRLATPPPADEPFRSFERDMFAYAYRKPDSAPFSTAVVEVPPRFRTMELLFASEVQYSAEGKAVTLVQKHAATRQSIEIRACQTTFKSGVSVKHLVLSPARDAPAAEGLDEYELIKLVKLWEDGEAVQGDFGGKGPESCVRVQDASGTLHTFNAVATEVFRFTFDPEHPNHPEPKAGTLELFGGGLDPEVWTAATHVAHYAETHGEEEWASIRRDVEGLAGIVQGIIDFEAIGADELTDVFAGVEVVDHKLEGLHKGTLIALEHEDRPEEKGRPPYPVSPYLLVPQAVLLYNEALIDRANDAWRPTQSHDKTRALEDASRTIHRALDADFLPNVFHYESERELYKTGHDSRGINERADQFRRRLADVDARYDLFVSQRRNRLDDARTLFLLVISVVSIKALWDIPSSAVVLLVAFMVVFYWLYLRNPAESKRMRIERAFWNSLPFFKHKKNAKQPSS